MAAGFQQSAVAWGNGGYSADPSNPDYGTHDGIADLALSIALQNVSFLKTTYHSQFLLGTEAPDNPDFVGDPTNHHVYFFSSGQVQDDKSAARASQVYSDALAKLKSVDLSGAAFLTGEMTHYVADVGVFGHTMGSGTDWGAEVHHSDYEAWFDNMIADHTVPTSLVPSPKDAYNATIDLARTITFGDGVIMTNVWMDSNYNWSDTAVFVPSALHSLDITILAVASAIDKLIVEAGHSLPPGSSDTPGSADPPVNDPSNDKPSATNSILVGLTMAAVIALSGILLVRTRRHR